VGRTQLPSPGAFFARGEGSGMRVMQMADSKISTPSPLPPLPKLKSVLGEGIRALVTH